MFFYNLSELENVCFDSSDRLLAQLITFFLKTKNWNLDTVSKGHVCLEKNEDYVSLSIIKNKQGTCIEGSEELHKDLLEFFRRIREPQQSFSKMIVDIQSAEM